jgi:hypothetical protein
MHRNAVLLAALLAAACHPAPAPPEPLGGPVPKQVCDEVKKALDAISSQGGVDYKDDGQATIEQAAWLAMGEDQRDAVAHALGFHASCAAGLQKEDQEVVVKSEAGIVLMRRLVDTRVDPMTLLRDRGGGGGG